MKKFTSDVEVSGTINVEITIRPTPSDEQLKIIQRELNNCDPCMDNMDLKVDGVEFIISCEMLNDYGTDSCEWSELEVVEEF